MKISQQIKFHIIAKAIVFAVILAVSTETTVAIIDKRNINFERFGLVEYLPSNTVKRIFQNRTGYLWLGTEAGLCRYDGYNIQVAKSAIGSPDILTSNNILYISEDTQQRLWIGTDHGVNVMTEFGQIQTIFRNHPLSEIRINCLLEIDSKEMWIGTENGLYIYSYATNSIQTIKKDPSSTHSISGNNINHIFKDSNGLIWIAMWGDGLCVMNPVTRTISRLPRIGNQDTPYRIFEDKNNQLWIASWGDGLIRIPLREATRTSDDYVYIDSENMVKNRTNSIYSIIQDDETGYIWMLTHAGLRVLTESNGKIEAVDITEFIPDGNNYLHDLYKDKNGNIWIGALNDGMYLLNYKKRLFQNNPLKTIKDKSGYVIIDAFLEHKGLLWVGLTNYGILTIDIKTDELSENYNSYVNYSSFKTFCVNTSDSSIWAGGNDIKRISRRGKNYIFEDMSFFYRQENRLMDSYELTVNQLYYDRHNRMWIIAQEGLFLVLPNMEIIKLNTNEYRDFVCMSQIGKNEFWVGSLSSGMIRIVESDSLVFSTRYYNTRNERLSSNNIICSYFDRSGNLWVGTHMNGLNRYDPQLDKFIPQNERFAITEENIMGITESPEGFLWLSTTNQIIRIDLSTSISKTFSNYDNILVSLFRPRSIMRSSEGLLYFGGSNGYSYIQPQIYQQNPTDATVVLTDIEIQNQKLFNNNNLHQFYDPENKVVRLAHNQQNIGIEFSSLNFTSSAGVKYAYRMQGIGDNEWKYTDSKRRFVNYLNLEHGTYYFEVKATNEDGTWSSKTTGLTIEIEPAPYQSWWAYLLYILIGSGLAYLIINFIRSRINLRNAITISKIEKEKTEELMQTKLRYFTNVSHELLTPLTIINCMISELKENPQGNKFDFETMFANINRLKRLLQQILDFRKTESGNMKLNVKKMDIVSYINQISNLNFMPLIKTNQIQFTITSSVDVIEGWFDEDKIDKIIYNLLSNAFKYTQAGGKIQVSIFRTQKGSKNWVKVYVSDNGKGIKDSEIQKVFKRFYSGRDAEANGIGLALTRDLVELHKGTIGVESEAERGTTFTFELPLDQGAYFDILETTDADETLLRDVNDDEFANSEIVNSSDESDRNSILLVDDNPDLLKVMQRALSAVYNVTVAYNGKEALDIIQKGEDIHLIISDVIMPEIDGLEFCKLIKENINSSHIPVILLTARNQIEDRIACYNAGADAYISKPFEMSILRSRINNLIHSREAKAIAYKNSREITINSLEFNTLDEEFLKKTLKIVEDNIADPDFTHEQLIDKLNTSKSTMYRKLKHLTALSPSEFVKNIRLKHAVVMMEKETANISEIAYAVGFSSPKYFATCFKEYYGISPREYIRKQKGQTSIETID